MLRRFTKKRLVVALTTVTALAAVGVAVGYFTTTGDGTGTASVGSAVTDSLHVTGTPDATALTPGGTGSVVSFTVANDENFAQRVTKIHLSSVAIDHSSATYTAATSAQKAKWDACDVTSGTSATQGADPAFYMADVTPSESDGDIGPSATAQALTAPGTLYMNDTGADQSNCEGAPLALSFTTT